MIPTARVFVKTNFLLASGRIAGTIALAFAIDRPGGKSEGKTLLR
jgi:hypothetical protein